MPDNCDAATPEETAPSSDSPSSASAETVPSPACGTALVVDLDLASLLAELGVPEASPGDDQQALLDAELSALSACTGVPTQLTGRVAGCLPAGPALAAWLATASPEQCVDADLPDLAAGFRRLASWAQARELAAVATLASRAAARNDRIRTDEDGRPDQVPPEAAAQLGLAMSMSQFGATTWTSLAIQLRWQLPGTSAALAEGSIDLGRARLIADATAMLSDEAAHTVEQRILPDAEQQTNAQLRAALRRAVIAADPQGAERRRKDAERRAKVSLFADEEGTATIAGSSLPGVHAAAAMARISAMARALKASGAIGGIDLLRANIFIGLLLGTLPLIPPAEGAPPDGPSPNGYEPPGSPPTDEPPDNPSTDEPPDNPPGDEPPGNPPGDGRSAADNTRPDSQSGHRDHGHTSRSDDRPQPETNRGKPDNGQVRWTPSKEAATDEPLVNEAPVSEPFADELPSEPDRTGGAQARDSVAGGRDLTEEELGGLWPDIPPPGDDDAPDPEDDVPTEGLTSELPGDNEEDELADIGPPQAWPELPAHLPSSGAPRAVGSPRPPAGLLDVVLPWSAMVGSSSEPGLLGRIGPVTVLQSRELLRLALSDAATEWRMVLADDDGRALAVERIRFGRSWLADRTRAVPGTTGVVGRLTLTVRDTGSGPGIPNLVSGLPDDGLVEAVRRASSRAAVRVEAERAAAASIPGACAHSDAAATYRPPPRIREYIAARDVTCRFRTCRQPAWRADLDHTVPWHKGGLTCRCNIGPECRTHHKIKQLPGWTLEQPQPGFFRWTTPTGRVYTVGPDRYPV